VVPGLFVLLFHLQGEFHFKVGTDIDHYQPEVCGLSSLWQVNSQDQNEEPDNNLVYT